MSKETDFFASCFFNSFQTFLLFRLEKRLNWILVPVVITVVVVVVIIVVVVVFSMNPELNVRTLFCLN